MPTIPLLIFAVVDLGLAFSLLIRGGFGIEFLLIAFDRRRVRRARPPRLSARLGSRRARHALRRRPAGRAPERAGDARTGRAGGARPPAGRGRAAADRGGQLRRSGARAADGRRGGGRRCGGRRPGGALRPRPERARLGAARGDTARPGQRHARGDGVVQPAQRQRDPGGGGRARRADPRRRRPAVDGDDQRLVRLPVRGRASIRVSSPIWPTGSSPPAPRRSSWRTRSASRRRGRSARLLERVSILGVPVGGHFHDTRHTGVACAWAAVEAGAAVLDASVGGLGGCPFAPRATGNVATEDVLYLLDREGVETGVDLDALIARGEVARSAARPRAPRPRLPRLVTVCYLASAMRMTPAAARSATSSSA